MYFRLGDREVHILCWGIGRHMCYNSLLPLTTCLTSLLCVYAGGPQSSAKASAPAPAPTADPRSGQAGLDALKKYVLAQNGENPERASSPVPASASAPSAAPSVPVPAAVAAPAPSLDPDQQRLRKHLDHQFTVSPKAKFHYVEPQQILDCYGTETLSLLKDTACSSLPLAECYSAQDHHSVVQIGPNTFEMILVNANAKAYESKHEKKVQMLHECASISTELGWDDTIQKKFEEQSESLMKKLFGEEVVLQVAALITSLGPSQFGGFNHVGHNHQILFHLDDWGPPSTIVHDKPPECQSNLDFLFPIVKNLPVHLLRHLLDKHHADISSFAGSLGITDSTIELTFPDQGRPKKRKKAVKPASQAQKLEHLRKQLAVVLSVLEQTSHKGLKWDPAHFQDKSARRDLEEGSDYKECGGLLKIPPSRVQAEGMVPSDVAFSCVEMPQYSGTKFIGNIHTNPKRKKSRAVVLLVGKTSSQESIYSGAEQITPLYLLCQLYEDLVLNPGEEMSSMDLNQDWLHLIFLELIFQHIRSVSAPDLYYYINRSVEQAVFVSGIMHTMVWDQHLDGSMITQLFNGSMTSKKGGKLITEEEEQHMVDLRKKLLKLAKDWAEVDPEKKANMSEEVKNYEVADFEVDKPDPEDHVGWIQAVRRTLERNTYLCNMAYVKQSVYDSFNPKKKTQKTGKKKK